MTPAAPPPSWRSLVAPGLATLVALAILVALGTWQLQRKGWKEDLIAQIQARAYGEPGAILPEPEWGRWQAQADEFRRVRVTGTFLNRFETPVYGLAPGGPGRSSAQGYYLMTPLRLGNGSIVMVNRGFVPMELKEPASRPQSQPSGEVTVTGLVRAPEERNLFTPADDPARRAWFTRDPQAIARANGLERVAPFYVEADATPNPGGWPRGGQTRLELPNNHLQYAVTWYGIALTLVGVFAAFAWRRLHPAEA
ncbi:SURF1 family protein [Microvirga thermotolerans]|uniref:SURF1-like protein n=1 Tax=Microvirga thermotolerans TaxID=2651334 RepID=A0A5P9JT36_9HYPH|nr:SURF1 family protein [Microvirga thermotolerans]QFU15797.1 SURF1 family protein [Microvirga thermotolerans]